MSLHKKLRKRDGALLDKIRKDNCIVCGSTPCDPCHILSVGAGGDDSFENVIPMCRADHANQHRVGWIRFSDENPSVLKALNERGWIIVNEFGISRLVRDNAS